jgi:methylenetetrahydrofolate reductase (NADPH)
MQIRSRLTADGCHLSFEIFPPKKDTELASIDETLKVLCELNPDFISVTF